MATASEYLEVDFARLWVDMDQARSKHSMLSRRELYRRYAQEGGDIPIDTFDAYLKGKSAGARLADGRDYNKTARIVNAAIAENGESFRVPVLTAVIEGPGDANQLRGRDSNPQPTGYEPQTLVRGHFTTSVPVEVVENEGSKAA